MSFLPNRGIVSVDNSTVTPLLGGATFPGAYEEILNFASISIMAEADVAGTLWADFSTDGVTASRSIQLSNGEDGAFGIHSLIPVAEFFKVRVVNGVGAQATIDVQTIYHSNPRIAQPTSRLGQDIGQYSDVLNTRVANDIALDTSRGVIGGRSIVNKFGESTNITQTESVMENSGAAYTGFLTVADTIRVKAGGDAGDTAAGLGAQGIVIQGLDQNFDEIEESIVTNGTLVSAATANTFIRVLRAWVHPSGTYSAGTDGANIATVNLETSGGIAVTTITTQLGQSELGVYTVPAGKTGYLVSVGAHIDGSKSATVRFFKRESADDIITPFTSRRLIHSFDTLLGSRDEVFTVYPSLPEKTDFWATATKNATGTTSGDVEFELILIDN